MKRILNNFSLKQTQKTSWATLGLLILFSFNNCGEPGFNSKMETNQPQEKSALSGFKNCQFNGSEIVHGGAVEAFQNSAVQAGSSCVREQRKCSDGVLSGSFNFSRCSQNARPSCLFNGIQINHLDSVTAFQNSTVGSGGTCVSEKRTCTNGVLSGAFNFTSCAVNQPKSCLFNGQQIANGQSIPAFANSAVPFGSQCTSESRSCSDGVLSGSFQFASCSVNQSKSCLFNGQQIAHGQAVLAFQTSSVAYGSQCALESRLCVDGNMSGTFQFASCSPDQPVSCLLNGQQIAHGQSVLAFQASNVPYGSQCQFESQLCVNGSLSGTYQYASCAVAAPPLPCAPVYVDSEEQMQPGNFTGYVVSEKEYAQSRTNDYMCTQVTSRCDSGQSGAGGLLYKNCPVVGGKACQVRFHSPVTGRAIFFNLDMRNANYLGYNSLSGYMAVPPGTNIRAPNQYGITTKQEEYFSPDIGTYQCQYSGYWLNTSTFAPQSKLTGDLLTDIPYFPLYTTTLPFFLR